MNVQTPLRIAGLLTLCALAQACGQAQTQARVAPSAPTAPGALPPQWMVPVQYRGEWHEKLQNCANAKDPTRLVITADHLKLSDIDGRVLASSTADLQLTVPVELTGKGVTMQRVFAFTLSPDQASLTAIADQDAGPGLVRLRCPGAATPG